MREHTHKKYTCLRKKKKTRKTVRLAREEKVTVESVDAQCLPDEYTHVDSQHWTGPRSSRTYLFLEMENVYYPARVVPFRLIEKFATWPSVCLEGENYQCSRVRGFAAYTIHIHDITMRTYTLSSVNGTGSVGRTRLTHMISTRNENNNRSA